MFRYFKPLLAAAAVTFCCGALAAYPDQPIRIIVPSAAGGGSDTLTRLIAEKLTKMWGQSVIVEIKPGASGVIGGTYVSEAKPDGYTLLMITNLHSATAAIMRKLPYDAVNSFDPVAPVGSTPMVLEVNRATPVESLAQLVAMAKAKSGNVTFGSAGDGSPSQLGGELLSAMSKSDMSHIPYKGAGQATSDLLGNHITFVFSNPMSTLSLVKSGQLKAIAVSSPKRMALLPDVPTVAESGYPGFDVSTWWGILAPKGVPAPVLDKLNAAVNEILRMPDIQQRFADMGLDAAGGSREALAKQISGEIDIWKNLVAENRLKLQ